MEIDARWRAEHPLSLPEGEVDKKSRGRVLVIGGSVRAPGVVRLTAEAALRVGAGRVRVATRASAAMLVAMLTPELGVVEMPEIDGEIAVQNPAALAAQAASHGAVVIGPGMVAERAAADVIAALDPAEAPDTNLVLDAAAATCLRHDPAQLHAWRDRLILTPHHGEMARLLDRSADAVRDDQPGAAREAARRTQAVVVLKGGKTFIAAPSGKLLHYPGGGPGLATGGSGDVLSGVIAGLLARGVSPIEAAAWGVWLHGEAGRRLAASTGPIGFLAGELLAALPGLLPR
ncbi:NAD(P)H-hydrate dehydratase [Sphingomonas sp. Xoc002]|uniref:NAD(P)H-hydrate dehydratase n=1 Tax=Sphingomonas sp. Xoc002 TaxID=2837624 RepID=UPI003D1762FF